MGILLRCALKSLIQPITRHEMTYMKKSVTAHELLITWDVAYRERRSTRALHVWLSCTAPTWRSSEASATSHIEMTPRVALTPYPLRSCETMTAGCARVQTNMPNIFTSISRLNLGMLASSNEAGCRQATCKAGHPHTKPFS